MRPDNQEVMGLRAFQDMGNFSSLSNGSAVADRPIERCGGWKLKVPAPCQVSYKKGSALEMFLTVQQHCKSKMHLRISVFTQPHRISTTVTHSPFTTTYELR